MWRRLWISSSITGICITIHGQVQVLDNVLPSSVDARIAVSVIQSVICFFMSADGDTMKTDSNNWQERLPWLDAQVSLQYVSSSLRVPCSVRPNVRRRVESQPSRYRGGHTESSPWSGPIGHHPYDDELFWHQQPRPHPSPIPPFPLYAGKLHTTAVVQLLRVSHGDCCTKSHHSEHLGGFCSPAHATEGGQWVCLTGFKV